MKTLKKVIRKTPIVRDIVLFLIRTRIAIGYLSSKILLVFRWLFQSKEYTNFTYDLTKQNKLYLASIVSHALGKDFIEIFSYIEELDKDNDLRSHIQLAIQLNSEMHFTDLDIHYGRRLGWYAIVRACKPKIVVETGVDKGMGSCVLTAALKKNELEGFPGYYYGTDINPRAGYLFAGDYNNFGEILYGDSIETLINFKHNIDVFIHDSNHSADYEEKEYEVIKSKINSESIILSDNAHITDKLFRFAIGTKRHFTFFKEQPFRHWYPGAGIGIAFH